ncbi:MAG: nicotinate phosphoribosyltransferase, partial [Oscillospiraceae bacterium]
DILLQGAKIDSFGVGERLITSKSEPVFGGVYKLVAIEDNGIIEPRIKISENVAKITNPYFKKVYRLYSNETGQAIADVLTKYDEEIDETKPYEIFDPQNTWKRKKIFDFKAVELQAPIFENGKCVYETPTLKEIRTYCKNECDLIWDEVKRFENPHTYYVDLSQKLWDIRYELLSQHS